MNVCISKTPKSILSVSNKISNEKQNKSYTRDDKKK